MLSGYRTIGQVKKQMATYRITTDFSASLYSRAEEVWAGYPPPGQNIRSITKSFEWGMKTDQPAVGKLAQNRLLRQSRS